MKLYRFMRLVVPGHRKWRPQFIPLSHSHFPRINLQKNKFWILLLCWSLAGMQPAWAQADDIHPSALAPLLQPASKLTFLKFKPGVPSPPQDMFSTYAAVFGLTGNGAMSLQKMENDPIGFTHYRFQQMHNQIPVEGSESIVHQKGEVPCSF